jgi:hypothetical protein
MKIPLHMAKHAGKTEIQQFAIWIDAMDSFILGSSDGVGGLFGVSEMFVTKTGQVFSVA